MGQDRNRLRELFPTGRRALQKLWAGEKTRQEPAEASLALAACCAVMFFGGLRPQEARAVQLDQLIRRLSVLLVTRSMDGQGRASSYRSEVKRTLAATFGGYTELTGVGGYVLDSGDLVEETIYQVTTWAGRRNDEVIRGLARMIKDRLQQESVFIRINGEAYLE